MRLLSGICQSQDLSELPFSGSHRLTAQQIPLLGCLVASGSSSLINTVHGHQLENKQTELERGSPFGCLLCLVISNATFRIC